MVGSAILTMELSSADISTPIRMAAAAKYRRGMSKPSSSAGRVRWLRRRSACGVGVEEGVGSCRAQRQRLGKRRDRAFGVAGLRRTFRSQVAAGASAQKRLSIGACGGGPLNAPDPRRVRRAGRRAWAQRNRPWNCPGPMSWRCGCAAGVIRQPSPPARGGLPRRHARGRCRPRACGPRPSLPASVPDARPRRCRRCRLQLGQRQVGQVAAALFAVAHGVGHDFMGVAEGQAALDR